MATRVEMIIETLKAHPEQKFTARDLAKVFIERYPVEMAEKQTNPRYDTTEKLIAQLAAEIGGERTVAAKKCVLMWQQGINRDLVFIFGMRILNWTRSNCRQIVKIPMFQK
ncbi:hypothetical protein NOK65_15710 [Vibrio parahaemolyticus]|nr:hypothetical protein [Vibrio parahaemolyticus]MCX8853293.1 hypothetical protein [Vibrio parahaemolyticus]